MSKFEIITILFSLAALGISLWNFKRISTLDEKDEYKSKSSLFHDTYSEVTVLIEKTENRISNINEKRLALMSMNSPYTTSYGCSQGHNAIIEKILKTNPIKDALLNFCSELDGITQKEDRIAFDRCMEIKVEVRKNSLEINKALSQAELTINDMHNRAHA